MITNGFLQGALTVVGIHALYALWRLFQAPSVNSIKARNQKAIPRLGDDDKITIWGFDEIGTYKHWNDGVSDMSMYVSRIEAYLRLIKQPYVKAKTVALRENPRGKVPFANIFGNMVDDSQVIYETIKTTLKVTVDDDLTEEQRTTGLLIQRLLTGSLYFVILNGRFNTTSGRESFADELKRDGVPPGIRYLVWCMVVRHQSAALDGEGVGKQHPTVVAQKGYDDVKTLASILGDKQYILNTKAPTIYDCDVYSFLVMLFYDDVYRQYQWVPDVMKECTKLVDYVGRMRDLLYPELSKK